MLGYDYTIDMSTLNLLDDKQQFHSDVVDIFLDKATGNRFKTIKE